MDGSATFLEVLTVLAMALGLVAAIISSMVSISLWRQRRARRLRESDPRPADPHLDGWDFVVDGRVLARLTNAGPPEDLNTNFVPFEVAIVPGHEAEIDSLLYHSNDRHPDDARICYRSRGASAATLRDSQVHVSGQDGRVTLKAYWD